MHILWLHKKKSIPKFCVNLCSKKCQLRNLKFKFFSVFKRWRFQFREKNYRTLCGFFGRLVGVLLLCLVLKIHWYETCNLLMMIGWIECRCKLKFEIRIIDWFTFHFLERKPWRIWWIMFGKCGKFSDFRTFRIFNRFCYQNLIWDLVRFYKYFIETGRGPFH